jgi:mevalonate kinase
MKTTSKVPGKIILSGEHSILHGCPALTAAVDKYVSTQVCVFAESQPHIYIEIAPNQGKQSWTMTDAKLIYLNLKKNKNLCSPHHFIIYATLHYLTHQKIPYSHSIDIHIDSELPIKSGWGASAAILVGLFKSLATTHESARLDTENLIALATECEHIQHGRSSGIDITTCAIGGILLFDKKKKTQPIRTELTELIIIHTGTSNSSTRDCVKQSSDVLTNNGELKNCFKSLTQRIAKSITEPDVCTHLPPLIEQNHHLLCQLGVVSQDTQHFIDTLKKHSIAAKVCGAGSIKAGPSGIVWAIGDKETIGVLAKQFGFTSETVKIRHS